MEIPQYLSICFWAIFLFVFGINFYLIAKLYKPTSKKGLLLTSINIGWPFFTGVLAYNDFFLNFDMPPHLLFMLAGDFLIFGIIFGLVKTKDYLLKAFPLTFLILIQVFRLPLEWWLFSLCDEGLNACTMTFEGYNFDIITALLSPFVAFLAWKDPVKWKTIIRFWNYLGLVFIVVVVTVALLSTPVPFRVFTEGVPNIVIAYFPYIWLPVLIVPSAVLYHVLCLRKLKLIS